MRLLINTELVKIVNQLEKLGLKVGHTNCESFGLTIEGELNKVKLIQIELGKLYPEAMFEKLPYGWVMYEYRKVRFDKLSDNSFSGFRYSVKRNFDMDIEADKESGISDLEKYLDNFDPEGFKAVWTLAEGL